MKKTRSPPSSRKNRKAGVGVFLRRSPSSPAHRAALMRAGRAMSATRDSDSDSDDGCSSQRPVCSAPLNCISGDCTDGSDSGVECRVRTRHASVPLAGGVVRGDPRATAHHPPVAPRKPRSAVKPRQMNIYSDSDSECEEVVSRSQIERRVMTPAKSPSSEDRRRVGGDATPLTPTQDIYGYPPATTFGRTANDEGFRSELRSSMAALEAQIARMSVSVKHIEALSHEQGPRLAALEEAVPRLQVAAEDISSWMNELERLTSESWEVQASTKETEERALQKIDSFQERLNAVEANVAKAAAVPALDACAIVTEVRAEIQVAMENKLKEAELSSKTTGGCIEGVLERLSQSGPSPCGVDPADTTEARMEANLRRSIQSIVEHYFDRIMQPTIETRMQEMLEAEMAGLKQSQVVLGEGVKRLETRVQGAVSEAQLADVHSQLGALIFDGDMQERLEHLERRTECLEGALTHHPGDPCRKSESGSEATFQTNPSFKGWDSNKFNASMVEETSDDTTGESKGGSPGQREKVLKFSPSVVKHAERSEQDTSAVNAVGDTPGSSQTVQNTEEASTCGVDVRDAVDSKFLNQKGNCSPPRLSVAQENGVSCTLSKESYKAALKDRMAVGRQSFGKPPLNSKSKGRRGLVKSRSHPADLRLPTSPTSLAPADSPTSTSGISSLSDMRTPKLPCRAFPWPNLGDSWVMLVVLMLVGWAASMLVAALCMRSAITSLQIESWPLARAKEAEQWTVDAVDWQMARPLVNTSETLQSDVVNASQRLTAVMADMTEALSSGMPETTDGPAAMNADGTDVLDAGIPLDTDEPAAVMADMTESLNFGMAETTDGPAAVMEDVIEVLNAGVSEDINEPSTVTPDMTEPLSSGMPAATDAATGVKADVTEALRSRMAVDMGGHVDVMAGLWEKMGCTAGECVSPHGKLPNDASLINDPVEGASKMAYSVGDSAESVLSDEGEAAFFEVGSTEYATSERYDDFRDTTSSMGDSFSNAAYSTYLLLVTYIEKAWEIIKAVLSSGSPSGADL